MGTVAIADQLYEKIDFKAQPLSKGEYEYCTFTGCDFSGTDMGNCRFIECTFSGCNLSMVKLTDTALRDVAFKDCKMLGLRFDTCNKFALAFTLENCTLNHSSFYKLKMIKAVIRNCQMHDMDLTECDLTSAVLDKCDLQQAIFDGTILEKADMRTAYNYSIDPERNKIKKAKFSLSGIAGLLDKYGITIDITR